MAAPCLLRLAHLPSILLPSFSTLHFHSFSCLLSSASGGFPSPSRTGPAFGSYPLKGFRWPTSSTTKYFASLGEGFAAADSIKEVYEAEQIKHRRLILYSKPGCCLCDQLKQRLDTVFLMGGDKNLSDVQLEVRDITTNPQWEAAFQYQIPVLARLKADNSEEILPRLSPRLGFEQLQKKLADALC